MIRRLTTHLSLALVFVVWAALLVGSGSDGAEVRASIQASNCGVWWDWTEDEWNYTVAYSEIRDYAARPPERALEAINVEWLPPELDALGNLCVIRGRLKIADDTQKRTRPVDWFQGITVYMGKTPGAKPDWSRGMDQKTALSETAVVCPSGEFEVRLDRRKSQHDRSRHQPLQFGLALARHLETGKGGQQVVWNSRAPAISATVKMLDVPAAAKLSRELELINSASGWPSSDPNGAALIRAVNALQQLGKERALATLEEYVDLTDSSDYHSESEIVFWIIRVLFEPIRLNDRIPCPMIAVFLVEEKSAAAPDWPLNPMAIVDDVPFMVGHQCGGSGIPEHPSSHIEWARRHGVVRDEPLRPTNPVVAAQALQDSQPFQQLDEVSRTQATRLVRSQARAMVDTILPVASAEDLDDGEADRQWHALVQQAVQQEIRWNAEHQEFVGRGELKKALPNMRIP